MRYGIDWYSTIIFFVAYGFSRIPGVPPRIGNLALTGACGYIAWYRYANGGLQGPNAIFVGIAAALAIYFLSRAFSTSGQTRRRGGSNED
jgi:hypothetical protein